MPESVSLASCHHLLSKPSRSKSRINLSNARSELDAYQAGLSSRPHGILANKIDAENSEEHLAEFRNQVAERFSAEVPIFAVSGKYGRNISPLLIFMRQMYDRKYNL